MTPYDIAQAGLNQMKQAILDHLAGHPEAVGMLKLRMRSASDQILRVIRRITSRGRFSGCW